MLTASGVHWGVGCGKDPVATVRHVAVSCARPCIPTQSYQPLAVRSQRPTTSKVLHMCRIVREVFGLLVHENPLHAAVAVWLK